jgi:hypothetical protein
MPIRFHRCIPASLLFIQTTHHQVDLLVEQPDWLIVTLLTRRTLTWMDFLPFHFFSPLLWLS